MSWLTTLDWVALALLAASLLMGAWRGLLYEALSLTGWVAAFFAASWLGRDLGAALPVGETPELVRHGAGMALVFIGVVFIAGFVAWLVRRLASAVGLRPADRVLGAVFGLLRGLALLLAAVALARLTPLHQAPWWQAATSVQWLEQALPLLRPMLPEALPPGRRPGAPEAPNAPPATAAAAAPAMGAPPGAR
ncbi:MAG: CvpA family protein [Comamonadaceae bacterium]|nr:CvpA family protein [Comamonadaceae bacterium]